MVDIGKDMWCRGSLVTTREESGSDRVVNRLVRRLTTPRGRLHFHPDYGIDMTNVIGEEVTEEGLRRLRVAVVNEVEADRAIVDDSVAADITTIAGPQDTALQIAVRGDSEVGPFDFNVTVDLVTLTVLGVSEAAA